MDIVSRLFQTLMVVNLFESRQETWQPPVPSGVSAFPLIGRVVKSSSISKRVVICVMAMCFSSGPALAGQANNGSARSWSGVIINSHCTADEAFAESAKCTEKDVPGVKLALYDDTVRQIYALDRQDLAIGHLGDSVIVSGTLAADAIHVTALKRHTAIGLAIGQKAPAFSARDQFGRVHTLATLKGPKGTVLLFYRSADW